MAWQEPKTDWAVNPKNPVAEDFNRIEGNVGFLKGDIETKKGAIVDALNTVGLASELTDTHATLASRITGANQGAKIITPGTTNQTIAKGFHSGAGYVKGDANLEAANIKAGTSIFGVIGSLPSTPVIFDTKSISARDAPLEVSITFPREGILAAYGNAWWSDGDSGSITVRIDGVEVYSGSSGIPQGGYRWVAAGERTVYGVASGTRGGIRVIGIITE